MSNPSLILPQSPAYGEDYVYAAQVNDGVVPLYNVLPLTFTRASGGTRINKDGLVQNMPYNLVTYSQDFSNGAWIDASSGTITRTSGFTDPMGGNTAFKLVGNNSLSWIANNIGPIEANNYTFSIWLKTDTTASVDLLMSYGTTNTSTKSITSTWVRYEFTASRSATAGLYGGINVGNGVNIYAWGAQVNIGSTAQPYLATTDRLNMPRITYPVGGGCGALLLEKQSTNVVFPSEDFSTTWSLYNSATITTNQTTSPDGTQNADKLTTANSANALYNVNGAGTSSGGYTASIFVKPINNNSIGLGMTDDTTGEAYVLVDVATGSGTTTTQTSNWTNVSFTWSPYGNGWYRITLTATKGSTGNARFILKGNSSSQYYIWGAQLEASTYATSYIPTTSTSATRIADECYKTGISNLIGQSEGTIFVDFVVNGQSVPTANAINIYNNNFSASTMSTNAITYNNGVIQCQQFKGNGTFDNIALTASVFAIGQRIKLAYRYKSGDFALYINGVQKSTSNLTMTYNGTKSEIYLNANTVYYGYPDAVEYNQFMQFPTALTNAELQALTS